ncbi:hypothetical protein JK207_08805 [Gluconobacter cerinus]|uniref:hypothetical protein n=1 Tax=Gluconobacter cerinus TaxID=38307 RepID=UPI001B8D84B9|nr:hypothetical protein [Gluconobacter cerinus]MBS1022125.1 hypothetical protein [Gluconobacter cerinus]
MTTQNVRSAHGLKSKERQFLQNTLSAYEKSILQAGFRHGEPITQVLIEIGRLVEDFDARLGAHESHISGHHQLMVACIERARQQIASPSEPAQEDPKKIASEAQPPGLLDDVVALFWRILREWQRQLLGVVIILGVVMVWDHHHLQSQLQFKDAALTQKEQLSHQHNVDLADHDAYLSAHPEQIKTAKVVAKDNILNGHEFMTTCSQTTGMEASSLRRYCRPIIYLDAPTPATGTGNND